MSIDSVTESCNISLLVERIVVRDGGMNTSSISGKPFSGLEKRVEAPS